MVGWPLTVDMLDNDVCPPAAYLPMPQVTDVKNPVVRIVDEANG